MAHKVIGMLALAVLALLGVVGQTVAQGKRTSTWEADTSITFHKYFEPFPRFDNPDACRDACLKNPECTGWVHYAPNFKTDHPLSTSLQSVCILGAGLKDLRTGAWGRTAGRINLR